MVAIDPSQYEVIVNLPLFAAGKVRTGQSGLVVGQETLVQYQLQGEDAVIEELGANPDEWEDILMRATVISISPAIDPSDRSIRVRLALDGQRRLMMDGAYVTTWIEVGRRENAHVIPVSSIVTSVDQSYVFVVDEENIVRKRAVTLGFVDLHGIEVLSGLSEGEIVVSVGKSRLTDGMAVTPVATPKVSK